MKLFHRRHVRHLVGILAVAALGAAAGPHAHAQGYAPLVAAQKMKPAAGLTVELAASEPLVRQPVAIEFDDRGRLWVVQYLQYPNPAGLKPVEVDRFSRTKYNRVPEPPPRGPRGADRVTILLDNDGDGRADHSKDFLKGLNLASGLAFGDGGVYVLQVPYLLFYADRNGDEVPDGDPQVLLSGFGMEDAHSVANSLTWGPDGWLYGCQGSTVTANIRGIEFQQGVWRYHPPTKRFELFCEGGGNSWGLDFDRHGNLFYTTNRGGSVMLHGVQGGYYWKAFGKHGALHNPFTYGYLEHVPQEHVQGGHVSVGGTFYFDNVLPETYRGKYVVADLLGHDVYWHTLYEQGSTFRAATTGRLVQSNDTWFDPSDLILGPDGAVYVADWCDKRTAHPDPTADWDRTNGRVFRIAARGAARRAAPHLQKLSTAELIEALSSDSQWLVRRARRVLHERQDPAAVEPLRKLALATDRGMLSLEALWALYGCGGFDRATVERLLVHPNPDIRWWTVRLLGDAKHVDVAQSAQLTKMAGSDPSLAVRSQLASTAKRLPADDALPIVGALAEHDEDASDLFQPLLLWWAMEQHAAQLPMLVPMFGPQGSDRVLARTELRPRLVRRYATSGSAAAYNACTRLLEAAKTPTDRDVLLTALDTGMKEQAGAPPLGNEGMVFVEFGVAQGTQGPNRVAVRPITKPLLSLLERWQRESPDDVHLVAVLARLGDDAARRKALAIAMDRGRKSPERRTMLALLGEMADASAADPIVQLAGSGEAESMRMASLEALERQESPSIADKLVQGYSRMTPALKAKCCDLLLGRKTWTGVLLAAVRDGHIPATDLSIPQLRRIALHGDKQLNELTRKLWGNIKAGTPEEKLNKMRTVSNDLRAAQGDPLAGREIFKHKCAACHQLYGEGSLVGPELTHANRKDRNFLLASLVDPSAVVRKEYMNYIIETSSGRMLTGVIVEQTAAKVTLAGPTGERMTLARGEIDRFEESPLSLMPENLLSDMKPDQIRALFSYLQTERPPSGLAH